LYISNRIIYPKLADRCINTLHKGFNTFQYLMRDSLTILPRIDHDPTTRLTRKILEHRAHARLKRLLFVALLPIATSRRCHLWCEVEEKGEVWRGEADVGGAAPGQRETFCCGERYAGKSVAVAEDGSACC